MKGELGEESKAIGHSAEGCVALKDPGEAKSRNKRENKILDSETDK